MITLFKEFYKYHNDADINIPDGLAITMIKYFHFDYKDINLDFLKDVPKEIFNLSKKFIKTHGNIIYRGGFEKRKNIENDTIFINKDSQDYSWTLDHDTAYIFANNFIPVTSIDGDDISALILKINNIDEYEFVISMDLVMENITEAQLKRLGKNYKELYDKYYTESEILIFDRKKINREKQIEIV